MMALVHVTCGSTVEARRIAAALLRARLVACANWWPVSSHYRWRGTLKLAREVMLELKTLPKLVARVRQAIKIRHSYELPVITVQRVEVDEDVEGWVGRETKATSSRARSRDLTRWIPRGVRSLPAVASAKAGLHTSRGGTRSR